MVIRIRWKLMVCYVSVLLTVTSTLYILSWISNLTSESDRNYAASQVRDDEEYRFARAMTAVNGRKRIKGRHAFEYDGGANETEQLPFSKLDPAPSLTVSILAPNRWTHEIDSYEPSYLLESTATLLLAIEKDLSRYGKRYASLNVTLCPTVDQVDNFSELFIVSDLLPVEAVKRRVKHLDSSSLSCRTVLDMGSCITQSVSLSRDKSYIVLLEDDLLSDEQLLQRIWNILLELDSFPQTATESVGAVILHVPSQDFQYTLHDSGSIIQLLLLSFGLTGLILSPLFHRWSTLLRPRQNVSLVMLTYFVSMLIINLIGRPRWTKWLLTLLHKPTVLYLSRSWTASSASAVLIPTHIAHVLGEYLHKLNCSVLDNQSPFGLKSDIVFDFLHANNHVIYTAWPSLFRHRGLYSIYKHGIHHPYMLD